MSTTSTQQSAIIYDFAARARAILESRGRSPQFAERAQPALPKVDYGSGWYHEAAIQDADRTRKQ